MHHYDVAYLRIADQDVILVPVSPRFGMRTSAEMRDFAGSVERHAGAAGLSGEVVPVWSDGDGGLMLFARPSILARLTRLNWELVRRSVNVRLHVQPVEAPTGRSSEEPVALGLAS